jgi:hypothetical protein
MGEINMSNLNTDSLIDNIAPIKHTESDIDVRATSRAQAFNNAIKGTAPLLGLSAIGTLLSLREKANNWWYGEEETTASELSHIANKTLSNLFKSPLSDNEKEELKALENKTKEENSIIMYIFNKYKDNDPYILLEKSKEEILRNSSLSDDVKKRASETIDVRLSQLEKSVPANDVETSQEGPSVETTSINSSSQVYGLTENQLAKINDAINTAASVSKLIDEDLTEITTIKGYVFDDKPLSINPKTGRPDSSTDEDGFLNREFTNLFNDILDLQFQDNMNTLYAIAGVDMREEKANINSLISLKRKDLKTLANTPDKYRQDYYQKQVAPIKQSIATIISVLPNQLALPFGILQNAQKMSIEERQLADNLTALLSKIGLGSNAILENGVASTDISKIRGGDNDD